MEKGHRVRRKRRVILFLAVLVVLIALGIWLGRSWNEEDFLVYQGEYYLVTHEPLDAGDCGTCVGEVVRQVPKSLFGNKDFESDVLPVGTEVYTLKEDDPNLPGNKLAVLVDGLSL